MNQDASVPKRAKHMSVRFLHLQHLVRTKDIISMKISTHDNAPVVHYLIEVNEKVQPEQKSTLSLHLQFMLVKRRNRLVLKPSAVIASCAGICVHTFSKNA